MTTTLVGAIEASAVNNWILSSQWLWPGLEILHFIGLSLLLGSMLVVDLRLAGLLRQIDVHIVHRLLPWATIGFLVNLVSGVLFFLGDPARYSVNIGFQVKMVLVLIAGLNALWFFWKLNPQIRELLFWKTIMACLRNLENQMCGNKLSITNKKVTITYYQGQNASYKLFKCEWHFKNMRSNQP
jgi:hypothetical protein